jgi:pimeloyl-ACP methyl ester carboxylesterase
MATTRSRKRKSYPMPRKARGSAITARAALPVAGPLPDLSRGVIVVLSGGGFDLMNPKEVRDRMDRYIADVNADPYVQTATAGAGLTFKLLPKQKVPHLHQTHWREICAALNVLNPTTIVLVGHSNGGAAAMDLARCLSTQQRKVDLLFSADSVLTLDDIGDVNIVPTNVRINVNTYVIPTPAWILAPFPFGKANRRSEGERLHGILNVGLAYNLGGAIAHRNAFYDLAGGDTKGSGFKYPNTLLDTTLAVLRGATAYDIAHAAEAPLQTLATKAKVRIEMESTNLKKTLTP